MHIHTQYIKIVFIFKRHIIQWNKRPSYKPTQLQPPDFRQMSKHIGQKVAFSTNGSGKIGMSTWREI